jgi:hypothetical protein
MRRIVWLLPLLVSTSALANSPLNHPPLPVEEPVSTVRCASFGFNPSYAQCTQLWFDKRCYYVAQVEWKKNSVGIEQWHVISKRLATKPTGEPLCLPR